MVVFAIMFVIADLQFLLFNDALFRLLNFGGNRLGFPDSPVPDGNKWFFLALAHSMMVMITFMSIAIAVNPRKYFVYLPVLIVSKLTSATAGLVFFFTTRCRTADCVLQSGLDGAAYYSNLAIFLSDFPLAIIAIVLYVQGRKHLFPESSAAPQILAG
jgi:hypothetical protein